MRKDIFGSTDLAQEIQDALHLQHRLYKKQSGVSEEVFQHSQYRAEVLLDWQLSTDVVVASLLVPLLLCEVVNLDFLLMHFEQDAVILAQRLAAWSHDSFSTEHIASPASTTFYFMQLRRLLRQAYLDLPDLSFILLVMADFDARLALQPTAFALWAENVFVPIAVILGMWAQRRLWLEKSLYILYPEKYKEIAGLTEDSGRSGKETLFPLSAQERKQRHDERKIAYERGQTFKLVEHELLNFFRQEELKPTPSIYQIEPSIAVALHHIHMGESKEELINRLRVRIECFSIQDCYHVLGLVHRLGKPSAPRYSERFRDYIASPQPNGYRALHTTIVYQHGVSGTLLVDIRILTKDMFHFNEYGVLYSSQQSHDTLAWWNTFREAPDAFKARKSLLTDFDIGTRSDTLYVFTPQGQVIYQRDGSTALDFAYHIHTELGHHAVKIDVNGKQVPYNYPLQNGDWIQVHYDPHFVGPDWFWLNSVSTASAKQKIRQGLVSRAKAIHEGRRIIEDMLFRLSLFYEKKKHYEIIISTSQLNAFLARAAHTRHLPDLETLYTQVVEKHLSANTLAQHFISNELATIIVSEAGDPLRYPIQHIHLCSRCCPVPGEPLLAYEGYTRANTKVLKVHLATATECIQAMKPNELMVVRWAAQSELPQKELLLLHIDSDARYGVLKESIDVVYKESSVQLWSLEAHTDDKVNTSITFGIKADTLTHIGNVQANLETIPGVRRIFSSLPSPSQFLALKSPHIKEQHNPYTYQEVYDRLMFYDRKEPLQAIQQWLQEPPPFERLILHGQRRVGKTSLAKYLMYEILSQQSLIQPVWIDFQDLSEATAQSVAYILVQSIYKIVNVPVPQKTLQEEPMLWLERMMQEIMHYQPMRRLLLIIDEFNLPFDAAQPQSTISLLFSNLRSVMSKQRNTVSWLLIVQDAYFYDHEHCNEMEVLLQQSRSLHLQHLDLHWAKKLVIEPTQRCGISFEQNLPDTIVSLTDGNPYLIQILCYEALRYVVKQSRKKVMDSDLQHIINRLTNASDGPRTFHHFINKLDPLQKIVLAAIASTSHDGVSVIESIKFLRQKDKRLRTDVLHNVIHVLQRQGVLALEMTSHGEQVSIPIKLFQRFVEDYISLDSAIDEWRTARLHNARGDVRL